MAGPGGNHGLRSTVHILLASFLAACRFEPHVATLGVPTLPPQPFGVVAPADAGPPESPEEAVERLLDELFDPFNMPPGQPYEGTIYEEMDRILAGAYAYYGYDLAELAASGEDNPLTEDMFVAYLAAEGLMFVTDPATGDEVPVLAWLQATTRRGHAEPYALALRRIGNLDMDNPLNYERNYLAALFAAHSFQVEQARLSFIHDIVAVFGDDAAGTYEYLLQLDAMGTEE
jgi:hypothetical protein